MSLTRAQLIMGDSGQGSVLPGQVQGVKQGLGVSIASDGTITFNPESAEGVVKTNNPAAYNNYLWPSSTQDDSFLRFDTGGNLGWISRGFALDIDNSSLKVALPFGTNGEDPLSPIPEIGPLPGEATSGSLYWNTESERLFICVNNAWVPASVGVLDVSEELLSGTYTIYVNPEIGEDTYVTGVYNPDATPEITNQMVQAGYTPQRPFKTIERAALEVARIQKGAGQDSQVFDRYVIKCSTGVHTVRNGFGDPSVSAWVDDTAPDGETLQKMNSDTYAGVILPRGVSIIGEDLRKTVIRPDFVPDKTGDIEDDRASIFRITGGAFFFNFTFKDKTGLNASHHLLECFSFVTDDELEEYYEKVETVFAQSYPNIIVNPGETEIVAPQPPGEPEENTDDVFGSSPYIFNCSVRSKYGLCGINANGEGISGLKSMVTAQFTGVSLQKDLFCWQRYNTGPKTWTNTILNYNTYISLDPNNLRMDPTRRSFHIRAVNNAFIQEVSVFAIGQGVHHWSKSGGELSITNSNSSFGGCAAIAEGYKTESFPQDGNWNVASIIRATNLTDQTKNVKTIFLGVVDGSTANNATTITLTEPLEESGVYPGIPRTLADQNYTLKEGSYLWIENPQGNDWRAPLDADAWSALDPTDISITIPMENQDSQTPGEPLPGLGNLPDLAGKRVYVRRLVDTRSVDKRRYSLILTNTDSNTRIPLRDYVIQTTQGTGGGIVSPFSESDPIVVNRSGSVRITGEPVVRKSQVVLQTANAEKIWTTENLYRAGDTVRYQNKHFTCVIRNQDTVFDPEKWSESYVHMESTYNDYDYLNNVTPTVYFDNDTDGNTPTSTCGYDLTTAWNSDPEIKKQYTTSTDYRGLYRFLFGIGFSDPEIEFLLTPSTTASRSLNPDSPTDMNSYVPDGAANQLANWPVEFRRPSIVRMFSHAWEWAGFLNYTKALPSYQGDLSPQNQFTYYFTNSLGGRVYATGYNQEGFLVTPAGLTDLSTGATTSVADIGNPFGGVDIPTYFPFLTVDNLVVNNSAVFNGTEFTVNGSITADNVYDPGLGLTVENKNLKVSIPDEDLPPASGTDNLESTNGSLYWDNELSQLFIRYPNGGNPVWVSTNPSSVQPPPLDFVEGTGIRIAGTTISKSFWYPSGVLPDLTYTTNTTLTEPTYYCNNLVIDPGTVVTASHQTTIFFCTGNVIINGTLDASGVGPLGGPPYSIVSTSDSVTSGLSTAVGFGVDMALSGIGRTKTTNYNYNSGGLVSTFLSLTGSGGGSGPVRVNNGRGVAPPGGAGGGGIVIRSLGSITVGAGGSINADGNPAWTQLGLFDNWSGAYGDGDYLIGGAGGGSGGTVILHSDGPIVNSGNVYARGGAGGSSITTDAPYFLGSYYALGGTGGGGGWVIMQSATSSTTGTVTLTGGAVGPFIGAGPLTNWGGASGGSNAGKAGYYSQISGFTWTYVPSQPGKLITYGSPFD